MPYSKTERIQLIEITMNTIAKFPNVGGYVAIQEVEALTKKIISGKDIPTSTKHIDNNTIQMLRTAGITQEDLNDVMNKRDPNRYLVNQSLCQIVLTARNKKENLTFRDAKDKFLKAMDVIGYKVESSPLYNYLTTDQIQKLKAANILFVDTEWALQPINIEGLDALLTYSNLDIAAMCDFFDTLNYETKKTLGKILANLKMRITRDAPDLLDTSASLESAMSKLDESFNDKLSSILNTPDFKLELKKLLIKTKLNRLSELFTQSMMSPPQSFTASYYTEFRAWLECSLAYPDKTCQPIKPIDKGLSMPKESALSIVYESSLRNLITRIKNAAVTDAVQLTNAFETALTCYVVNHANEICQSFWKAAENTALSLTSATQAAVIETHKAITSNLLPDQIASANHSSNRDHSGLYPIATLGLLAVGIWTTYTCFFKKSGKTKFSPLAMRDSLDGANTRLTVNTGDRRYYPGSDSDSPSPRRC